MYAVCAGRSPGHVISTGDGGMWSPGPLYHQGLGTQPRGRGPTAAPDGSTTHREEKSQSHVAAVWLLQGFWLLQVCLAFSVLWSVIGQSGSERHYGNL